MLLISDHEYSKEFSLPEEDGNSNIYYGIPDPEMSHSHPEIDGSNIGAYTVIK